MHNLGDVDMQHAAGATATGTHGTGRDLPILAAAVVGVRMVTAAGEVATFSAGATPGRDARRGCRWARWACSPPCGCGWSPPSSCAAASGAPTSTTAWPTSTSSWRAHRNFDFYWYPRRDEVRMRTWNPPGEGPDDLPFARCIEDTTGPSGEVLPGHSGITRKFEETEYSVPAEAGPACFREVRQRRAGAAPQVGLLAHPLPHRGGRRRLPQPRPRPRHRDHLAAPEREPAVPGVLRRPRADPPGPRRPAALGQEVQPDRRGAAAAVPDVGPLPARSAAGWTPRGGSSARTCGRSSSRTAGVRDDADRQDALGRPRRARPARTHGPRAGVHQLRQAERPQRRRRATPTWS